MEIVQGIVLFVLGVGAAFLAYFAWQAIRGNFAQPAPAVASNFLPVATLSHSSPGING